MRDKAPKDNLSQYAVNVQQEYVQWEKVHNRMKEAPPPEGREYLKHAMNLLNFLEGIAELHPISKAVIGSFKAVILYEQDRQENDARVAAVFLSQTDMMRVLLEIDRLGKDWGGNSKTDGLQASLMLSDLFVRIRQDIKACANSIDTYYKESRFVRFWKSQDWKARMLGYVNSFNQSRLLLQQALSIHVASGVNDLVSKMDVVLSRLFTPCNDWEKDLDTRSRKLGDPSLWINNSSSFKSLVATTKDPLLDNLVFPFQTEHDQLEKMKTELGLSLDALCDKNMDVFELKLNFHTQQLQDAIQRSASFVVRTLSGPYSRVLDEDLSTLWKEMNWIFCVENSLFTSALFEYFLDRFSGPHDANEAFGDTVPSPDKAIDANPKSERDPSHEKLEPKPPPKFILKSSLFRSTNQNHPDGWTLHYISIYGQRISAEIDRDRSGFIRISEVNAFTQNMPSGWSLAQWCAYAAAGWPYECRLYRKRIHRLLFKMLDMQALAVPLNRSYVIEMNIMNARAFQYFCREPREQENPKTTLELRNLVMEKIKTQDIVFRSHLASLNWNIEDQSTIQLVYGDRPLESYVLQLCTLLLERCWEIMQAGCHLTIDAKEWKVLFDSIIIVLQISSIRVATLKAYFDRDLNSRENIKNYYGGIWSSVDLLQAMGLSPQAVLPYDHEDLVDYFSDLQVLDDFPLRPLPAGCVTYLKYKPWEDYVNTLQDSDIPAVIPKSWEPTDSSESDDKFPAFPTRYSQAEFPYLDRICDRCQKAPILESVYGCVECLDFDLCASCYKLPETDHSVEAHKFEHPVFKATLFTPEPIRRWMELEAKYVLEQLWHAVSAKQRSSVLIAPGADDVNEIDNSPPLGAEIQYTCSQCKEPISLESTFYKCLSYECHDYYLCNKCGAEDCKETESGEHRWWHWTLVLTKHLLIETAEAGEGEQLDAEKAGVERGKENDEDAQLDPIIFAVEARIASVEERLQAVLASTRSEIETHLNSTRESLESRLVSSSKIFEERVSQLESKFDANMEEIRQLFGALMEHRRV